MKKFFLLTILLSSTLILTPVTANAEESNTQVYYDLATKQLIDKGYFNCEHYKNERYKGTHALEACMTQAKMYMEGTGITESDLNDTSRFVPAYKLKSTDGNTNISCYMTYIKQPSPTLFVSNGIGCYDPGNNLDIEKHKAIIINKFKKMYPNGTIK